MLRTTLIAVVATAALFGFQAARSEPAHAAPKIETAPCSVGGVTDGDKALAKQLSPKLKDGLDGYQVSCARAVVEQVKQRGMDERAATIAVATTMVEGNMHNYTRAVDYDSLGLFQQRPSAGWGSVEQIINPSHATDAFPDRYGQHAKDAATIIDGIWS